MKLKYFAVPLLLAAALATGCQESAKYEPVVYMTDAQSNAAMSVTPWVWRLHEADMCAAHIDEREGQTWK